MDPFAHVDLGEVLERFAGRIDKDFVVLGAEIYFAVHIVGRPPDAGPHVVQPVGLTGFGVQAVQVARLLALVLVRFRGRDTAISAPSEAVAPFTGGNSCQLPLPGTAPGPGGKIFGAFI